ncbi:MAG: hypothetical protein MI923_02545 [Phycisphaerales bacterium]|nr:hypothetical protein [Phycisphaerales bacterium]
MSHLISKRAAAIALVDLFAELRAIIEKRCMDDDDLEMLGYVLGTWMTYEHLKENHSDGEFVAWDEAMQGVLDMAPLRRHAVHAAP